MPRFASALAVAVAVLLFVATSSTRATVLLDDNFDSYANQAAFQVAWPAIGTTTDTTKQSAQLSTVQSSSPTQSIFLPISTTAATSSTEFRNRKSFAESGNVDTSNQLIFSFDYYDSNPTGSPQRNFVNLQDSTAPGSTNQLVSLGLNNNQTGANSGGQFYMARILGYDPTTGADPDGGPAETVAGSGAYFKLNDFGVGGRTSGWHTLKAVISTDDGLSTDYSFYVDGALAEKVSNVGTAASIRSYDNVAIGSGLTNGGVNAYVDNVHVEYGSVPEPGTLSLLAIAGIGLLRRRRA